MAELRQRQPDNTWRLDGAAELMAEAVDKYGAAVVPYIEENADWKAVDNIMAMRGVGAGLSPEELQRARLRYASNSGGFSLTGSADDVARQLTLIAEMGYAGIALTLVNYADDLPFFASEVLPRLVRNGVRHAG